MRGEGDEDEPSEMDIWANNIRDSILQQVHTALDAYERASQENISALFAREVSQRSEALATVVATRTVAMEDRLATLEQRLSPSSDAPRALPAVQGAEPERNHSQDAALDARLAAVEASATNVAHEMAPRLALLEASFRNLRPLDDGRPRSPRPREDVATAAALNATSSQFVKSLQALEGEILVLQGELVMLQTRTQMQGVSGSIFSLRAVDMDERSRVKSLEVLVKKESEVKRLMDRANQAKERGGMAELLTQLGVRVTKSPATGDLQALHFSLAESGGNVQGTPRDEYMSLMPAETLATRSDARPNGSSKREGSMGRI